MSNFLKKALSLVVEFEEDQNTTPATMQNASPGKKLNPTVTSNSQISASEVEKFEKHFEKLFEDTNLTGPDYYEFWKTMETLEQHIPDEKIRMAASFQTLSIQGLDKQKLIDTANQYREVLLTNKIDFEKAIDAKSESDIGTKRQELKSNQDKILKNTELIQKLNKEITEASAFVNKLKAEIGEEEAKLNRNKQGYLVASNAMIKKINDDIEKIKINL